MQNNNNKEELRDLLIAMGFGPNTSKVIDLLVSSGSETNLMKLIANGFDLETAKSYLALVEDDARKVGKPTDHANIMAGDSIRIFLEMFGIKNITDLEQKEVKAELKIHEDKYTQLKNELKELEEAETKDPDEKRRTAIEELKKKINEAKATYDEFYGLYSPGISEREAVISLFRGSA
jgi:hypothetical protein